MPTWARIIEYCCSLWYFSYIYKAPKFNYTWAFSWPDLSLLELTSRAGFARRSAVRTIDKRPSSAWEKQVPSFARISKTTSKKHFQEFLLCHPIHSCKWDIYRLVYICLGATEMEFQRKQWSIFIQECPIQQSQFKWSPVLMSQSLRREETGVPGENPRSQVEND